MPGNCVYTYTRTAVLPVVGAYVLLLIVLHPVEAINTIISTYSYMYSLSVVIYLKHEVPTAVEPGTGKRLRWELGHGRAWELLAKRLLAECVPRECTLYGVGMKPQELDAVLLLLLCYCCRSSMSGKLL